MGALCVSPSDSSRLDRNLKGPEQAQRCTPIYLARWGLVMAIGFVSTYLPQIQLAQRNSVIYF